MSIDPHIPGQTGFSITACWRATKQCYRIANKATCYTLSALLRTTLVLYFAFCALVLGLRFVVLPNIDNYKVDVERMATRAIGNRVLIGDIQASWSGLHPRLSLDQVVIHDKSGNAALTLPNVSATLSWLSIPVGELRLHQLVISNPDMDVRRGADGKLYVAGILLDTGKTGSSKGADWVLSQREIVVRDGKLRWNDEQRAAPELPLNDVNLVLRNEWRHHRFALKATPPASHSGPLDIRAAFDHPHFARSVSDAAMWKGELYADLHDTDLTVWRTYVDYPIDMQQGKGSVRAWLSFDHAKVANFTADLTLSNVSARLGKDLEPMNLVEVAGRISLREDYNANARDGMPTFGQNGHAISLTDFTLQTDDGLYLPRTTISESYTPARNGRPARTEINAGLLDLQTAANFAERLPLPAEQRQMLADFAPRGILRDFSAQWQGAYPEVSGYNVKGEFAGLSLKPQAAREARPKTATTPAQAAVPAIPGFENLTGRVDANDRGGSFSLVSSDLALHAPGYFTDPVIPFERFNMQASWAFQDNSKLLLDVQKIDFMQGELAGAFSGKHLMPLNRQAGKSSGTIDLVGKLNRIELRQVGRYLPIQTPKSLHEWLTGALAGGVVKDVRLKLKGDLSQFPFGRGAGDKSRGEFSVLGKIEGGKLNYAPSLFAEDGKTPMWPIIEDINGTIAFDRARMEIVAASAKSSGTTLSNVKAVIPDLTQHDMMLGVDGEAAGPLQNFLHFTNASPVAGWIEHFTEETKASGNAKLSLSLQLPLNHMHEAKVKGGLHFAGNNVTLRNIMPPLVGTTGKLEFHEKGFNLAGIKTNFLGGPATVSGGTQRDGTTLVKAEGSLSADGLRKIYATPVTQRSAERITGATRYTTSIRVKNKQPEVVVEANLVGVGLDFPAPLRKAVNESMPFRFELSGLPSTDASVLRDEIRLSLGTAIAARYERQKGSEKDAAWRVLRGGIGVNVPPPQPDSGLIVNASMKSLDIDAWRRALTSVVSANRQDAEQNQPDALGIAQYLDPEVLAANATELIVLGRKLDNVVVGASHQNGQWQANIDSEQASGYVTWMEPRFRRGSGRVTARLASLIIPKSAASDVTELLEGNNTTTQMPALDIVAENFELFGKKFGSLEVAAQNARGPNGREWRINKLSIANPDGELSASGKWTSKDGESLSSLAYTLKIADAGRLLDRFGFQQVLRGGKGEMKGEISWKGLPFALDIPTLTGDLQLDLASGQFLKVDPSAAKLLGVLSLQSLPRRLVLDFRDVFSEGFAFDGVNATATIAQGIARTDNFKMRGVAATVLIDGTADIDKEAQNLHVVVIPDINVGAASVVYGLAVNPVIGVGTFLAQLFLREPLMKAFTFEYQVTGPWKDPLVTKLLRKPAETTGEANNRFGTNG
ncbi:YhdP family protein [Noviherbaspirillum saxi]|uniref:TIGR02099 family protein n=1 Tax=Noviherbaspirillum saxi TaxID=2320863 RepID=A0A3A3FI88_9BURK|nr:YhdP family protein [Noviherbaspirillum saxi]RJF94964.1 TIGR02099 family protein [Noviherbaspirillum saxi]